MSLHTRSLLDKELDQVRNDILRLNSMVDTAIANAMEALYKRDVALAHSVVANDAEANRLRYEIEEECLRILATQQPAAIDLRTVIAAIHLAVELERIGDHAAGIAKLVERMENEDALLTLHKLPRMAQRARDMVNAGVQAYVRKDVSIADNMVKQDDKLDKQYNKLFQQTLEEMTNDQYVRRATFLLWVGHSLERIGDRATNIAERVIFMVRNEYVEIA
ncbi:MAG: phosphate signaling complex protein PhoU [Anaerolineales bacterium]|nr:phosphate signaling complex protein PhoU [Anaerolineales bacterium]MCB9433196.1 phosphate signaling complex protein PhoU [Ardenticatenaceae bacterium]